MAGGVAEVGTRTCILDIRGCKSDSIGALTMFSNITTATFRHPAIIVIFQCSEFKSYEMLRTPNATCLFLGAPKKFDMI